MLQLQDDKVTCADERLARDERCTGRPGDAASRWGVSVVPHHALAPRPSLTVPEDGIPDGEIADGGDDEDAEFVEVEVPECDTVPHRALEKLTPLCERKSLQEGVVGDGGSDEPNEGELYQLEGVLDALESNRKPTEDESDSDRGRDRQ